MAVQKFPILITSMGSLAAEGILACLGPFREHVHLIATNSIAEAPALFDADVAYLVPPTADRAAFAASLARIIAREQPRLVINGRDEEVEVLAELAASLGTDAVQFLAPPVALAPVFNDKYLTCDFARQHGLPFVPTASSREELHSLIARHGFPLIAKPRKGGFASKGVRVLFDAAQADVVYQAGNMVFQPFIGLDDVADDLTQWNAAAGIPWMWNPANTSYMIDLVFGHAGALLRMCTTVVERDGSTVSAIALCDKPGLLQAARQHAQVLGQAGMRGPVDIQGSLDAQGRFVAYEWNARYVGTTPAYALLGVNLVEAAIRHFIPELALVEAPPVPPQRVFRPKVFRAVPESGIAALRRDGVVRLPHGD